jgi:hypothetical protein
MKFLAITSLKEYQKTVNDILHQSGIPVYSATKVIGHKDEQHPNLLDSWFSSGGEEFDSIFIFSFTEDDKAVRALQLINDYNTKTKVKFPIRTFIMPVEKSSH